MNRFIQYPFRERIKYLNALPFSHLLRINSEHKYPVYQPQPISAQRSNNIKQAIISFLPKKSLAFLTRAFNYTYPLLPIFSFNQLHQKKDVLNLQVAISAILIGDFLNQLSKIDNKAFNKYIPAKYLLLSADYFHIKGSVFGSSLNKSQISYNMSRIEGQLSNARLIELQSRKFQIQQFCDYLEWSASPHTYGYASLYSLQSEYKQQEGAALGYNLGLLKSLQSFNVQPSRLSFLLNRSQLSLNMETGKQEILIECLISEISRVIQRGYWGLQPLTSHNLNLKA